MRHKTISVDFNKKVVTGVQEIEFIPAMDSLKSGVANLLNKVFEPLRKADPTLDNAYDNVNRSLAALKMDLQNVDNTLQEAGFWNMNKYQTRDRRFAEEALSAVKQLREVQAVLAEQAELIEELVQDNFSITIKK